MRFLRNPFRRTASLSSTAPAAGSMDAGIIDRTLPGGVQMIGCSDPAFLSKMELATACGGNWAAFAHLSGGDVLQRHLALVADYEELQKRHGGDEVRMLAELDERARESERARGLTPLPSPSEPKAILDWRAFGRRIDEKAAARSAREEAAAPQPTTPAAKPAPAPPSPPPAPRAPTVEEKITSLQRRLRAERDPGAKGALVAEIRALRGQQ